MSAVIVVAATRRARGLVGFVVAERHAANPMLPLDLFASRQFTAANVITFVVYAAIGGFFFLFVSFLQISLGYSPIAAGAASLPVTALTLLLSARVGHAGPAHRPADPAHRRAPVDGPRPAAVDAPRPGRRLRRRACSPP